MTKHVLNTLLLFLMGAAASAGPASLRIFKDGKYHDVKIREYRQFHLNDECFKKEKPHCEAFAATQKKVAPSKSPIPLEGNPAARFCLDHGGMNRILLDDKRKQYDYCLFKDGSLIDAWDLYDHFNPKKVIK